MTEDTCTFPILEEQLSRTTVVRIGAIVVTTVLRIVIAVLFHVTALIITIVVVLSVIGLTTVMHVNSSSSSPLMNIVLVMVTKTVVFRTTMVPNTILRTMTVTKVATTRR